MEIVSVFPNLLPFWMIAPFILRLGLGFILVSQGVRHAIQGRTHLSRLPHNPFLHRFLGIAEAVVGALLLIGLYTQVAGLFGAIGALLVFSIQEKSERRGSLLLFYFVTSLSLVFLGPGIFSVDLPI